MFDPMPLTQRTIVALDYLNLMFTQSLIVCGMQTETPLALSLFLNSARGEYVIFISHLSHIHSCASTQMWGWACLDTP